MIESDVFVQALQDIGVDFFTGVPDSILGGIIAELMKRHLYTPAVREDEAVAMAAGAYMAGKVPAVLMQNSGLGTSLNTLISLNYIYQQPCILIVSWRGQGGKDAPEHLVEATAEAIPVGAHVFVTEAWGSWFEFALPDRPVFVDPRIELFPDRIWNDYDEVMSGREGWQAVLDRWHVDAVVLQTAETTLRSLIAKDARWRLAYDDDLGSVFVRA